MKIISAVFIILWNFCRRYRLYCLIFILTVVFSISCLMIGKTSFAQERSLTATEALTIFKKNTVSLVILIWTHCDYIRRTFQNCPNSGIQCLVTTDRNLLNESSAIIFCIEWMKWSDIPPRQSRRPDQYYVFFTTEAPPMVDKMSHVPLDIYRNFFNLTMTYRLDSDIPYPYGQFLRRDHEDEIDEAEMVKKIKSKTKMIAWVSSHCRAPSGRERFIGYLNRYLPVDKYGRCGQLECARKPKEEPKHCEHLLDRDYKFYISFENSICYQYVSEKFYKILGRLLMVPIVLERKIVLSTTNDTEMAKAINKSFIAADDFGYDAKKLAAYMNYLDTNITAYMEYFQWRRWYRIIDDGAILKPGCSLCDLISKGQRHVIDDIYKFYNDDAHCMRPPRFSYS